MSRRLVHAFDLVWQGERGRGVGVRRLTALVAMLLTIAIVSTVAGSGRMVLTAAATCTNAQLMVSPTSPQVPGTIVTLTGSASCAGPSEFRFWMRAPGLAWMIIRDYSNLNTYNWETMNRPVGTYGLEVDVRSAGSMSSYEAVATTSYLLNVPPCIVQSSPFIFTSVSVDGVTTASSSSPTGTQVTISGGYDRSEIYCAGVHQPVYRFWIQPPGGRWSVVQDYSSSISYLWAAAGPAGVYNLEVDIRDASAPSTDAYDITDHKAYTLVGCRSAQLAASPPSPQSGGPILLTASADCSSPSATGTPSYRFWLKRPGEPWVVLRDYDTAATLSWSPQPNPPDPGVYRLEVDVRNLGSAASYESTAVINYTFAWGCTTLTLNSNPASPSAVNTDVTFSAAVSGPNCPPAYQPDYRFWIKAPGQAWSMVQDFSPDSSFGWVTTGVPGTYQVEVDVRDRWSVGVAYDLVTVIAYTLN